jgi:hypothetical protein
MHINIAGKLFLCFSRVQVQLHLLATLPCTLQHRTQHLLRERCYLGPDGVRLATALYTLHTLCKLLQQANLLLLRELHLEAAQWKSTGTVRLLQAAYQAPGTWFQGAHVWICFLGGAQLLHYALIQAGKKFPNSQCIPPSQSRL